MIWYEIYYSLETLYKWLHMKYIIQLLLFLSCNKLLIHIRILYPSSLNIWIIYWKNGSAGRRFDLREREMTVTGWPGK